jgi:uncharacterized membrane protein YhhN
MYVVVAYFKNVSVGDKSTYDLAKPLLMPLLALFLLSATNDIRFFQVVVFAGLIVSGIGDTAIAYYPGKEGLTYGIMSFFAAHMCYIGAVTAQYDLVWSWGKLAYFIPVALILYKSLPKYHSKLGSFRWKVYIYMLVLLYFNYVTVLAADTAVTGSLLMYMGSVLFIFSDSLLAMEEFGDVKVKDGQIYLMASYIASQFMIAISTMII